MTAAEQIIRFLLEQEDEEDEWKSEPERWDSGEEWKNEWTVRIDGKTYDGITKIDAFVDAFFAGAFPEYPTSKEFNDALASGELKRNHSWEVVRRPSRWMQPIGEEPYYADEKSISDYALDAYENAMTYPEGSPEREKFMRLAREMSAKRRLGDES